jgi:hypothetical protein
MRRSVAVELAVLLVAVAVCLAQYPSLANVQRIYIDKLGNNDDAERFRSVGARELEHVGFATARNADDADAILKGTFIFANWDEKSGGQLNFAWSATMIRRSGRAASPIRSSPAVILCSGWHRTSPNSLRSRKNRRPRPTGARKFQFHISSFEKSQGPTAKSCSPRRS